MKSKTLTKADKEQIVTRLVTSSLKDLYERMRALQIEAYRSVWECVYPTDVRWWMAVNPKAFRRFEQFTIFTTKPNRMEFGIAIRVADGDELTGRRYVGDNGYLGVAAEDLNAYAAMLVDNYHAAYTAYHSTHRELTRELNAVMASVSTNKRLLEVWPELLTEYPETESILCPPEKNLPAVIDIEPVKEHLRRGGAG